MRETTTTAPDHTCYGARFCGAPWAVARAECPACTPVHTLACVAASAADAAVRTREGWSVPEGALDGTVVLDCICETTR